MIIKLTLRLILLFCAPFSLVMASEPVADYVITDAKVYTSNPEAPWAEALAVKGADIIYVGENNGIERFIGEQTKIAKLDGKLILPGLISTHEHPLLVMGVSSGLMMENRADKQYMMDSLKAYLENQPQGPFLSFGGSYEGMVDINRKDIDQIVSDKPFVMVASSGHGGWVNSKALEAIGVVKGKADPIDFFERDKDGVPTGYVGTSAAIFYTISQLGLIEKESILEGADEVLDLFRSQGITTVYDAGVTIGLEDEAFAAISELEKENKLTSRISASAAFAQRPMHIDAAKEAMTKYGKMYNSELFRISTLKIHGDGDWGGYTVGMLEPFDTKPDSLGMVSFPDQNQLNNLMLEAARQGYDLHVHMGGDRTARMVLDGFESLRKAGFKDVRLTTGHTTLVDPEDIPRFKEHDLIVNTFATAITVDNPGWREAIGDERYSRLQPMKSFVNDGVKVVLSADWPTSELDPFLQIYTAMTRSRLGEDAAMPAASERLSLEDAIRAYTADAAYALRMENFVGSLEVGKRADLILLDRDIFNIPTEEIPQTNVLMTIMNGKIVHEEALDWSGNTELSEAIIDFDVSKSFH